MVAEMIASIILEGVRRGRSGTCSLLFKGEETELLMLDLLDTLARRRRRREDAAAPATGMMNSLRCKRVLVSEVCGPSTATQRVASVAKFVCR
jgi:hypothetical protein